MDYKINEYIALIITSFILSIIELISSLMILVLMLLVLLLLFEDAIDEEEFRIIDEFSSILEVELIELE